MLDFLKKSRKVWDSKGGYLVLGASVYVLNKVKHQISYLGLYHIQKHRFLTYCYKINTDPIVMATITIQTYQQYKYSDASICPTCLKRMLDSNPLIMLDRIKL